MHKLVGRALVGLVITALATILLAPPGAASPIGDAEAAMMAAWEKAGGDTSPLGARKGDVYPVGDGFALEFDGGKMFYTPSTGARYAYGPILDKYESLGGPAGSDLGFPTINEVPGLSGPDSRVSTFSASDKPVIFWTPEHGAFVVRGAINAAWDKLGSSDGALGVPVGDETYDGEVASQKFSGGQVSWNRDTKEFTTEPAVLAEQLKGLQVPIDPTAAINMAWRAAGGANGPLGVKQGEQYPIGGDGIAQNFAGGKVYFSPATGANAVESDILAKYESLGGPVGSDLGFPVANEADAGIPSSRICTFSAADKPVIFWSADHGAFVVRGAMKAAWDKLRGPNGKLGAPVGDQAVDGDVISQKFSGGTISWNRAKNAFSTDPANLAPLLSGLQISGQNQPSTAAMPPHAKKTTWQWWWLAAGIGVLVILAALVAVGLNSRRVRARRATAGAEPDRAADAGYAPAAGGRWGEDFDLATDHLARADLHPAEEHPVDSESGQRVSWPRGRGAGAADVAYDGRYGGETPSGSEQEDPDAVDTDSIPLVTDAELSEAGYPGLADEDDYSAAADADYAAVVLEDRPEDVEREQVDDDEYVEVELEPEDEYADSGHPDSGYRETAAADHAADEAGPPEAPAPETAVADYAAPVTALPRAGRHAAEDTDETEQLAVFAAGAGLAVHGHPTIHLPLEDPYQAPDGYPIKASTSFGLYYTPDSALYQDTLAEIWLASEQVAQANGFTKAD